MFYRQLKKIALLLIVIGTTGSLSAQSVLKIGGNPARDTKSAVLDVQSTTKGFLLPGINKAQRDAIVARAVGLQVWCSDCNTATEPVSGELDLYLGGGWAPFTILSSSRLNYR